ncbi:MAG: Eco57I restriction-modification methylase domain-containing protein, partial [Trebonia sp.]
LRDVIGRCVYGVDLNPMAVELAKVSLWLEALDPGKPLSFLDAHLKCGNALIGATPALIDAGIPDAAFKAVEGDDESWARTLRLANEKERTGQGSLFDIEDVAGYANTELAAGLARIVAAPSGSLHQVHEQAAAYRDWAESASRQRQLMIANAWCAAFMWRKAKDAPPAITYNVFKDLKKDSRTLLSAAVSAEVDRLAGEYGFFHWHLEFPDIFRVPNVGGLHVDPGTGWAGGFTALLGNPPWDKVDFEDKKYFSVVEPTVAALAGQKRRDRIREWENEHHEEGTRYRAARRRVKSTFLFVSSSEAYPQCAKGLKEPGVNSLQTDMLFAELFARLAASAGRVGCITPTAIATGAGGQHVFKSFTRRGGVASLYDFENGKPVFPGVHASYKFCLLSLTGKAVREPAARYAFFLNDVDDLDDPNRVFALSPEELALINPNTGTLPIFRNRRDAVLTADIYRRVPVLWDETKRDGNNWQIRFKRLFDMTDDSDLFRTREQLERDGWRLDGNVFIRGGKRMLPLYESKMAHHFDHRWNSFYGTGNDDTHRFTLADKQDPANVVEPRYWIYTDGPVPTRRNGKDVKVPGVSERLAEQHWERGWLYGWRDVCRATDERTAIPAFLPRTAVGHKFPLMFPGVSPNLIAALVAVQSSLVFDFAARQKIGGISMALFIWKQLPVPTPAMLEPHLGFILPRVLELVYTAYDMTPLARDLGDEGEPFRWDPERRARLRAELDAFYFRLYGIADRADVDYILETFQTETGGLRHNEIKDHGYYRTKEWVLAEYDRMAAAEASATPYESTLEPKPGSGPRHPPRA